jgi:hypothetical protein
MVNIKPSRRAQELRLAARNVPDEAIEPASSIAMTASSSSSMVTDEIRQLWSFSGSPSILIAQFNSRR